MSDDGLVQVSARDALDLEERELLALLASAPDDRAAFDVGQRLDAVRAQRAAEGHRSR